VLFSDSTGWVFIPILVLIRSQSFDLKNSEPTTKYG
jgi:hypothetical protein